MATNFAKSTRLDSMLRRFVNFCCVWLAQSGLVPLIMGWGGWGRGNWNDQTPSPQQPSPAAGPHSGQAPGWIWSAYYKEKAKRESLEAEKKSVEDSVVAKKNTSEIVEAVTSSFAAMLGKDRETRARHRRNEDRTPFCNAAFRTLAKQDSATSDCSLYEDRRGSRHAKDSGRDREYDLHDRDRLRRSRPTGWVYPSFYDRGRDRDRDRRRHYRSRSPSRPRRHRSRSRRSRSTSRRPHREDHNEHRRIAAPIAVPRSNYLFAKPHQATRTTRPRKNSSGLLDYQQLPSTRLRKQRMYRGARHWPHMSS